MYLLDDPSLRVYGTDVVWGKVRSGLYVYRLEAFILDAAHVLGYLSFCE